MGSERSSVADKRRSFRRLHESGCFVLPNPWDLGSARFLQQLGFKALASTSAGFAWTQAAADGAVSLGGVLAHLQALVGATDLPVNADFQNGFAAEAAGVAENVRAAVATGIAGLSIEDASGDGAQPLYPLSSAIERIRAARGAIDASGEDVMLVGRAECFLTGHPDPLNESLKRLKAYAQAGADCLFAPGARSREQIAAIVQAVAPKPVNVLVPSPVDFTLSDLEKIGVRRVSVGSALAGAAWGGFLRAARGLAEGRFDGFADNATYPELNGLFGQS